jgi:hypothetical protein
MFLILLLASASALTQSQTYPRTYLRGLEHDEHIKMEETYVSQMVDIIVNDVLRSASKGLSSYCLTFEGCEEYVKRNQYTTEVSVSRCKRVTTKIYNRIAKHFPDSEIVESQPPRSYCLMWA